MPTRLVDRQEVLEAHGRLWRGGPKRVLLVRGSGHWRELRQTAPWPRSCCCRPQVLPARLVRP